MLSVAALDGPLVRCTSCGLHYVGHRHADFTFTRTDAERSRALALRVQELGIVDSGVEAAERPLRLRAAQVRLARLSAHLVPGASLLDVGCATGTFLEIARASFSATGVEPDPGTSLLARAAGLPVTTGTLADVTAPLGGFDAITLFHVIEHLDSPARALHRVRELLAPGGVVMIETPTVDCVWFRVAPQRWRQLIPDHYFFFSRATLERMLRDCGLEPIVHVKVGRHASLRFLADRLRRSGVPLTAGLSGRLELLGVADRAVYVNPGDIMSVIARAVD